MRLVQVHTRAGGPGGVWGGRTPLELQIYRIKFLKIGKIIFFPSIGPPLGKNRSPVPVYSQFLEPQFQCTRLHEIFLYYWKGKRELYLQFFYIVYMFIIMRDNEVEVQVLICDCVATT